MDENQGTVQEAVPVQEEKMLPQSDVNKIIAREKAQAREAGRRESEEKYQRELEALNAQRTQQEQRNAQVPRDVDANAIYQQIQERFNKEMQERQLKEQMAHVANNYLSKVAQGRTNYSDFDEITKDFDPTAFPQLIYLLSGIENAGDVLYELAKNPNKLVTLHSLSQTSPKMAQNELLKLAQSITANKQAQSEAENQTVPDPLDRLNPSRVSGSNGKMGIRDLRNQPWLRA